jgi:hypothetical protein
MNEGRGASRGVEYAYTAHQAWKSRAPPSRIMAVLTANAMFRGRLKH